MLPQERSASLPTAPVERLAQKDANPGFMPTMPASMPTAVPGRKHAYALEPCQPLQADSQGKEREENEREEMEETMDVPAKRARLTNGKGPRHGSIYLSFILPFLFLSLLPHPSLSDKRIPPSCLSSLSPLPVFICFHVAGLSHSFSPSCSLSLSLCRSLFLSFSFVVVSFSVFSCSVICVQLPTRNQTHTHGCDSSRGSAVSCFTNTPVWFQPKIT